MKDDIYGGNQENLTILFNTGLFKAETGARLANDLVWAYPNQVINTNNAAEASSSVFQNTIQWTFLFILMANVLVGDSSPLLWGMLNTLQIIYYFPLLTLNYPTVYKQLLSIMKVSDLEIDIPIKVEYQQRLEVNIFKDRDFGIGRIAK